MSDDLFIPFDAAIHKPGEYWCKWADDSHSKPSIYELQLTKKEGFLLWSTGDDSPTFTSEVLFGPAIPNPEELAALRRDAAALKWLADMAANDGNMVVGESDGIFSVWATDTNGQIDTKLGEGPTLAGAINAAQGEEEKEVRNG